MLSYKKMVGLCALLLFSNISSATPFVGIGVGTYNSTSGFFPFVATTKDSGATWNYPRAVLDDLTTVIDPHFVFGLLRGAGCSGLSNESVCVAAGSFCKTDTCGLQAPLIAI